MAGGAIQVPTFSNTPSIWGSERHTFSNRAVKWRLYGTSSVMYWQTYSHKLRYCSSLCEPWKSLLSLTCHRSEYDEWRQLSAVPTLLLPVQCQRCVGIFRIPELQVCLEILLWMHFLFDIFTRSYMQMRGHWIVALATARYTANPFYKKLGEYCCAGVISFYS